MGPHLVAIVTHKRCNLLKYQHSGLGTVEVGLGAAPERVNRARVRSSEGVSMRAFVVVAVLCVSALLTIPPPSVSG